MAFPTYIATHVPDALKLLTSRFQKTRPSWIDSTVLRIDAVIATSVAPSFGPQSGG